MRRTDELHNPLTHDDSDGVFSLNNGVFSLDDGVLSFPFLKSGMHKRTVSPSEMQALFCAQRATRYLCIHTSPYMVCTLGVFFTVEFFFQLDSNEADTNLTVFFKVFVLSLTRRAFVGGWYISRWLGDGNCSEIIGFERRTGSYPIQAVLRSTMML
jgi:hypothetical protein